MNGPHSPPDPIERTLASAGCIAPADEAVELREAAARTGAPIEALVERRTRGEPLAWITGRTTFCGIDVSIEPGVYVPRPQTQALARRAIDHLPPGGVALDLCTGSGAIAVVLQGSRPPATVVASDADPLAVACARRNGITTSLGDLDDAMPDDLRGTVDVLTAVPPYVPSAELRLLPRDVVAFEPTAALDGGRDGTDLLLRIVGRSGVWLRAGGWLLLELGGGQALEIRSAMQAAGFGSIGVLRDPEGDVRAIEGRLTRFRGRG